MANLTIFQDFSNPSTTLFDFADLTLHSIGSVTTTDPTSYIYTSGSGYSAEVSGSGFTYDGGGNPTAGTVDSITIKDGFLPISILSGLSIPLTTVHANAGTANYWSGLLSTSDTIVGYGGDDNLFGFDGADVLIGGTGDDAVDGGAGADTIRISGNAADFTISHSPTASSVTDNNAGDGDQGTDTLTGIETIDFDDTAVHLVGGGGFATIQAAVNAATAGDTILVTDGTYTENVLIDKSLTLMSTGGKGLTTIDGQSGIGALGAIQVQNGVDDVTIGGTGAGFTILGIDNGSPGVENAAVYLQGSQDNFSLVDNTVTARGDAGLISEFGGALTNATIDNNEFDGQTFLGAQPAGVGFGSQFTTPNVPRQLVTIGEGGSGPYNSGNITFSNNTISGTTGGISSDDNTSEQGNTMVTIDVDGADISDNTFSGETARFATALRARGPNTDIQDNTFDNSGGGDTRGIAYGANSTGTDSGNVFTGGTDEDFFQGSRGADDMTGGGSRDTFIVGSGNDTVDGGADEDTTDTVLFAGNRADFTITATVGPDGFADAFTSVTDNNAADGDEGANTLTSIEAVSFDSFGPGAVTYSIYDKVHLFDGSGALVSTYTTIGAAVTAASAGDTVMVRQGVYHESDITVDKEITIIGEDDGADGLPDVFIVADGGSDGFDITGDIDNGGSATVTIRGIAVHDGSGSGVRIASNTNLSNLVIEDAAFRSNAVHGVGMGSGAPDVDAVTIRNSTFEDNGQGGSNGSGDIVLFGYNGDATIEDVSIFSNKTEADAVATRGDNAIQIAGFEPGTYDVDQPIGTVTLTNVSAVGAYHKPHLAIQGFNDLSGLTFTNVDLFGAADWGYLVFIDPVADGAIGAPADVAGRPGAYVGGAGTSTLDLSGITVTNQSANKGDFDVFVRGTDAADIQTGTDADDVLGAISDPGEDHGGEDVLKGMGGNDILFGGLDNDTLDGGTGTDTAAMAGARSDSTITRTGLFTYTIVDNNAGDGDEGTDSLNNVEGVTFSDGITYELDVNSPDFIGALNRFDQSFENSDIDGIFDRTNGWSGITTLLPSGTDGVTSPDGSFHAQFQQSDDDGGLTAHFTRFDGYRVNLDAGFTTQVDVYLDPGAWSLGEGFDFSVAANGQDGSHIQDFIFHLTKDTSTGDLLVGASNNTNFDPREDLDTINHASVGTAGWYTLEHKFYQDGDGDLEVAMNLLDASGNWLFTEIRNDGATDFATEFGGNRYGWFTNIDVSGGILVDNLELSTIDTNPIQLIGGTAANQVGGATTIQSSHATIADAVSAAAAMTGNVIDIADGDYAGESPVSVGLDGLTFQGDAGATNIDLTLNGTNQTVMLEGESAIDVTGSAEDETVHSNNADNTIAGGDGDDTVVYEGVRADFTVTEVTDGNGMITGFSAVTDNNAADGDEGSDTLTGVEIVQFDDVTLDASGDIQTFDGTTGDFTGSFATIQAAVNAASSGDTVRIAAGSYDESVNVDKALSFEGAGATQTMITSSAGSVFNIVGDLGAGNTLSFDGVQIHDAAGSGIEMGAGDILGTLSVDNSDFSANTLNGFRVSGGATLANAVIDNSTFNGNGQPGGSSGDGDIIFFNYGGNATLSNLQLTGMDRGTGPGENGIQFRGDTGALGTVSLDTVTVSGLYEKQPIAFFNYDNVNGLTMKDVTITADSLMFGTTINFDGIGGKIDFSDPVKFNNVDVSGAPATDFVAIQGDGTSQALTGSGGTEVLRGGTGNDTLKGNGGDDLFVYAVGDGNDQINGGGDTDTLRVVGGASTTSFALFPGAPGAFSLLAGAGFSNVSAMEAVTFEFGSAGDTLAVSGNFATSGLTDLGVTGGTGGDSVFASGLSGLALDVNTGGGMDTIEGGAEADDLQGGDGDDMITGGGGNDTIDGDDDTGNGTDTAVFSGNVADYTIGTDAVSSAPDVLLTVQDDNAGDGDDGLDTLTDIEILQFADARILVVGADGFATIQDAVDASAPGDTILVTETVDLAPGGDSQVQISHDLTITGVSGATIVPVESTGSSGDSRGMFLVDDGVTLDVSDVTIDGSGFNIFQGFRHKGSGTFDNVSFENIGFNPSGPTYAGTAIAVFGSSSDVDVINSSFDNIGRVGVLYFGSNTTGEFRDNTYTGKGDGDFLDYTLDISNGATIQVTDNTVTDNRGVASSDGSTSGAFLVTTFFGPGTDATFAGNTMTDNSTGILVGVDTTDTSTVTLGAGNTITGGNGFVIRGDGTINGITNVDATVNWTGGALGTAINGSGQNDNLTGGDGNDTMDGGGGNDTIDGGLGADIMQGGLGDDTFIVDNVGDVVNETGPGTDSVQSSVSFSLLGRPVENLTLTGNAALNGTGNSLNNMITGNDAANSLSGGLGNDTLDGGLGADQLTGGAGEDVFIVDNAGDQVFDSTFDIDEVRSSVDFNLTGQVLENLTLTGNAAINGTGNSLNNMITGNDAVNSLNGGLGNDTLDGGAGADQMTGGGGQDVFIVDNVGDQVFDSTLEIDEVRASVDFNLTGQVLENLTLTGNAAINGTGNSLNNVVTGNDQNNVLTGNDGDDMLDGGLGADAMHGGRGNDTFVVDNVGDTVTDFAAGTDTVQSSVSFSLLGQPLENLTLTGTDAINGTGNSLANVITGNAAANILTGGGGDDTFVFAGAAVGSDRVTDFTAGTGTVDKLDFSDYGIGFGDLTLTMDGTDTLITSASFTGDIRIEDTLPGQFDMTDDFIF